MSYDDWQQEQGEREYASEERESKDQWRYDAYGDERGDARATLKQFHTDRAWQAALSSTKADDVTFIERPCITERLAAPVTALNAGITGAVIVVLVVARWYFFGE